MSTITMMECEDIIEKLGGKYTMLNCDCSCGTCKDCEGCIYEQNVYLHDALMMHSQKHLIQRSLSAMNMKL